MSQELKWPWTCLWNRWLNHSTGRVLWETLHVSIMSLYDTSWDYWSNHFSVCMWYLVKKDHIITGPNCIYVITFSKLPVICWHNNFIGISSQWGHNERVGISNHQCQDCLLNHLFRHRSEKTSKLCVTGLCEGNSLVTCEFPTQRTSNTKNVSIWWCHNDCGLFDSCWERENVKACSIHFIEKQNFLWWWLASTWSHNSTIWTSDMKQTNIATEPG